MTPHDYLDKQDFSLVERLLKTPRYKIPEHLRDKIITSAGNILDSREVDEKTRLSAAKLILEADRTNIKLIELMVPKKVEHYNVKDRTDEELIEAIKETRKYLPPIAEGDFKVN